MKLLNRRLYYGEEEIYTILENIENLPIEKRNKIRKHIIYGGYGMDTSSLLNIISDPVEYNLDYLYSLDSEVTEELIEIAEGFGLI